ncbi:MAG: hypothetical protein ACYTG1_03450 [Planctomycetota bacterium]
MHVTRTRSLAVAAALVVAAVAVAGDDAGQRVGDPYPLGVCIVSGEKLDAMGGAVVQQYDGREVRFCCKGCVGKFEADAEGYLAKIDEQIIEQQLPHYPMTACIVMPEESLEGPEAEPVNYVYGNRLVRFCCKGCVRKFKGDPDAFLATLDEAVVKQQLESYPLGTCVVGGGSLDGMGGAVNYVFGNRLVRFCCKGCIRGFDKDPLKYVAMIDAARGEAAGHDRDPGHDADHDHGHGDHAGHDHD